LSALVKCDAKIIVLPDPASYVNGERFLSPEISNPGTLKHLNFAAWEKD
jgi:hypothetical protein